MFYVIFPSLPLREIGAKVVHFSLPLLNHFSIPGEILDLKAPLAQNGLFYEEYSIILDQDRSFKLASIPSQSRIIPIVLSNTF